MNLFESAFAEIGKAVVVTAIAVSIALIIARAMGITADINCYRDIFGIFTCQIVI